MSDVVIRAENLGKKYIIQHQRERQRYVSLRDVLANRAKSIFRNPQSAIRNSQSSEDFWALKDINFEIERGEVVGIIGRNGAGKSTLLKILSRITEPTNGYVGIKGRVASLLEVGTGFHPELTGRENIYLNGAILGMTRSEIKRKFDEIVAFAEIEKFLDTPVKRYSSGMYVRLAFAVAAYLEPEILIVDEVLAVGDAAFQKKCLGKMQDVSTKEGRTVLFVSHNMGVVSAITQRCFYLQGGQFIASGKSREIVEMYLMKSNETVDQVRNLEYFRRKRSADEPVTITGISVNSVPYNSNTLPTIDFGTNFSIEVELHVSKMLQGANMDLVLKNTQGQTAVTLFSWDKDYALFLEPGLHTVTIQINNLPLAPGNYVMDMGINQSIQTKAYDVVLDFPLLSVVNNGQITHWLERPWGAVHCESVEWICKNEAADNSRFQAIRG